MTVSELNPNDVNYTALLHVQSKVTEKAFIKLLIGADA